MRWPSESSMSGLFLVGCRVDYQPFTLPGARSQRAYDRIYTADRLSWKRTDLAKEVSDIIVEPQPI